MVDLTPQAIQSAALQLTDDQRLQLAMDLLDSLPDDDAMLSFDDPNLIEKLEQRGVDEEGAMSCEQLRSEIK
jgi:hypothetical protein